MSNYVLDKIGILDIDATIKSLLNPKDLFNIECIEDADNIVLLKAQNKYLYNVIKELENRISRMEGKK